MIPPPHRFSRYSKARQQANSAGIERFRRDVFGISVHFGLYSIDGRKEWNQCLDKIPRDVYAQRRESFNPTGFNAQEWVDEFVRAGATAFMVTTKHHDGFCLFRSQFTDFTSTDAPFRRDLIGELAEACHRRSVSLHLYHSLLDWHHPLMRSAAFELPRDFTGYCSFMKAQLTELLTNYGPIAGVLFDGWWPMARATTDQVEGEQEDRWEFGPLYDHIHHLQPQCMITNNHHVLPLPGEDYQVWEIDLPGENTTGFNCTDIGVLPKLAWMTATTNGWCWQPERDDYHSAEKVMDYFMRCRAMDASIYFNLGPMGDGRLNPREIDILRQFRLAQTHTA